ncbi:metallophosphatase [Flavimarina sp. Hel_I_48]|uniref:metallophosphatase n=1 Tax=Flavimarina sp. Hel_I_48 TaxID=1392488 RepID=UPI0004DF4540|nr:metallophosphatase [Flavimarina sp. Hel_I_48]
MRRRDFIRNTAAATAFTGLATSPVRAMTSAPAKHITILHTNDVHSHIEPFDSNDPEYANQGGVARRLALIEAVRQENPNTLLLDAGDIFQGTPYFNFYGGELEFKLMTMLKYDAATVGNHDFDNGVGGLAAQMPNAGFKLLVANYDFSNTLMEGLTKPYEIYESDGIKIGVFGLGIELDGLVDPKMYKETKYLNALEIAQDMTRTLKKEEGCDLVICLSHLGYAYEYDKLSDQTLAAKTQDIDLIIGGHTHTFLPKPLVVKNAANKNVLINQVGWAGINMGRIDFYFDEGKNVENKGVLIQV